jgi:hypothetical protein
MLALAVFKARLVQLSKRNGTDTTPRPAQQGFQQRYSLQLRPIREAGPLCL